MQRRSWGWAALPILVLGLSCLVLPFFWQHGRPAVFLIVLASLAIELVVIGWLVNGRPVGAFIDSRNMLSLSKMQAAAWTVLVLAAMASAAAYNAALPVGTADMVGALRIAIPNDLLLAMGISATSLVAAPAILSMKSKEEAAPGAEQRAADRIGTTAIADGKLLTKASPDDASWADLFTGDELGNAGTPDLGKIQQAFISLGLIGTYAAFVFQYFSVAPARIDTLPLLDPSFVWLLGISHASYIAYKAAPHGAGAPREGDEA